MEIRISKTVTRAYMCVRGPFFSGRRLITLLSALIVFTGNRVPAQPQSNLVKTGANGRLVYTPDAKGNIIPDFSAVGYMNGDVAIPLVPVVKTLSPVAGDNYPQIQAAIDSVSQLPVNTSGFRGAILLKAGNYAVGDTIKIKTSGIVLRGEGVDATCLIDTARTMNDFIIIQGSGGAAIQDSTRRAITDAYVPIGTKKITVASGHTFKVGERVILTRTPNQAWITMLVMDTLGWTADGYVMNYRRCVVAVNGNAITLDAPVVDPIDPAYAQGSLVKYTWNNRIDKIGIENMRLESYYSSDTDEVHGWDCITFLNTEHGWVRNVDCYYFGCSAVTVERGSNNISILNCRNLDPKATNQGGRKYSFNISGERNLFKNCYATKGRHDYITGAKAPGPNVFTQCKSDNQVDENGPHQRWATGILFDNIVCNYKLNCRNRGSEGTGQGWAGAQCVLWNNETKKMTVESPQGHINWAIGNIGTDYVTVTGTAYKEYAGTHVSPASLYEKQLSDRLGTVQSEDYHHIPSNDGIRFHLSKNMLTIVTRPGTLRNVELMNILGRKIYSLDHPSAVSGIRLTRQSSGVYLVKAVSSDGIKIYKVILH